VTVDRSIRQLRDRWFAAPSLGSRVRAVAASGRLVVQPRMGFDDPATMAAGLLATRRARAETVGTLTLDSYTRTRDYAGLSQALAAGLPLNGYPLVSTDAQVTLGLLLPVHSEEFPVQVRHGSPDPREIVDAMLAVGLTATEGGPVSYSLPYGRTPIADALVAWQEACRRLAAVAELGARPHLESFGGCVLGQLCPPSLLIAITVLEAVFFAECGIGDVSLSYAQQANAAQDEEALYALRRLAHEFLPPHLTWHVVLYSYMGVFPRTPAGAALLVERSAELAARTATERLIVKTAAEAYRIPRIEDNVAALERAGAAAARTARSGSAAAHGTSSQTYAEAKRLITATLNLRGDAGSALVAAFERGYLDVPFCLHPDNHGAAQSFLGPDGWLGWSDIGRMPLHGIADVGAGQALTARGLLEALSYVQDKHDREAAIGPPREALEEPADHAPMERGSE
jgi:methylaspartate mutase epsilon subunit